MLEVLATSHYYSNLAQENTLPDIQEALQHSCKERFRRIDRFTRLCLIGSAACVNKAAANNINLDNQTGLYIGSRYAALETTANVHRQMMTARQIPKPAHFINTLSNSAGYYVARNLGLPGKNLFISRGDTSFEAALNLAHLDLQSGQINQALVGVVEEGTVPFAEHRMRLGLDENQVLAEGSHWFLVRLNQSPHLTPPAANTGDARLIATISGINMFLQNKQLEHWLEDVLSAGEASIFTSASTTAAFAEFEAQIKSCFPSTMLNPPTGLHHYPARIAGIVAKMLENGQAVTTNQSVITIQQDKSGRFFTTLSKPC